MTLRGPAAAEAIAVTSASMTVADRVSSFPITPLPLNFTVTTPSNPSPRSVTWIGGAPAVIWFGLTVRTKIGRGAG